MASVQPDDDMAEFQRRSNDYQPDLSDMLPVGPRQSTQALIAEYAGGDHRYVQKTTALARTHPEYRIIKGDGQCGWRALATGYFETLFNLRNAAKVQQEMERLRTLNSVVMSQYQDPSLLEMFVDGTFEVFDKVLAAINNGASDDGFVAETMNESSDPVVFYFKMVTEATMKGNPDAYEAFCQMPVDKYCELHIMPMQQYINQPGLQAIADAIIRPAGFALEVLYLDLSDVSECTTHRFVLDGAGLPTIRLLYRPGHYDLLYEAPSPTGYTGIPQMQSVEVHLAHQTPMYNPFYVDGFHDMYQISEFLPGYSIVPNVSQTHTQQQIMPEVVPYPNEGFANDAYQQPMTTFPPSETTSAQTSLPVSPVSPQEVPQQPQLAIRLSPLTHEPMQTIPLQTAPFKNSQYNQAHYQNTEFQPAMWIAEDEYHKQ